MSTVLLLALIVAWPLSYQSPVTLRTDEDRLSPATPPTDEHRLKWSEGCLSFVHEVYFRGSAGSGGRSAPTRASSFDASVSTPIIRFRAHFMVFILAILPVLWLSTIAARRKARQT